MDDLTKELWQGVTERVNRPEPVYQRSLGGPLLAVADQSGWQAFLVSRKMGAMLALACVLGLLGIVSANPFASASVSERVSDKLGQPATCTQRGATVGADSPVDLQMPCREQTRRSAQCFAISGRDIRQLGGRRDLGYSERPAFTAPVSVQGRCVGLTQSCPIRPRRPHLPW